MAEEEKELTLEEQIMEAMEPSEPVEEETVEAVEETADEPVEEVSATEAEPIAPDEELEQGLLPPENWDADRKAAFEGLPTNEAKESYINTVKSLERGFQTKFDELATTRKEHEQIASLMQPLEHELASQGLDRVAGIRMLVAADQALRSNPAQGLSQIVQQFGGHNAKAIVQELANQYGVTEAASDSQAYVDPDIQALREQNQMIMSQLQQNQHNALAQQQQEAQNQVALFKDATDDNGNLLHPHFEKVEGIMTSLMNSGVSTDLQDLYDRAVYAEPTIRDTLINQKVSTATDALNDNRKKQIASSKAASKNVKTNHVAPDTPEAEPDNVLESVRKAMQASAV